jgi:SHS2 domain-containing protein
MAAPLPFEELEHTADLRLRVRGADLKALFVHAAQGVFYLMRGEVGSGAKPVTRQIVLESSDTEALLVDWLNELLYLSETRRERYDLYTISTLGPTRIEATVQGTTQHIPHKLIKATTYFDLAVVCNACGYETTITLDT